MSTVVYKGSTDKDTRRQSSTLRGRRGGLRTPIPMRKAKAMAHGFHDRVGGPFNETRDGSGSEDCNCCQRWRDHISGEFRVDRRTAVER
jgi:hypothetical protein